MIIGKSYIEFRQPDDWHAHLREGELMKKVINLFNVYGRVVCMGNLADPVDDLEKTVAYQSKLLSLCGFSPIIGIMLTKNSTLDKLASLANVLFGRSFFFLKYMPEGITTNSGLGIPWPELKKFYPILKFAEYRYIPIMIHAETDRNPKTGLPVDQLWREDAAVCLVEELAHDLPNAIINVEHVSTPDMIELIKRKSNLSGTISPNHLVHCRDSVFEKDGTKKIHQYFKPIAKHDFYQKRIIEEALSGNPKFFFGSDSAPHERADKESRNLAGAFNALTNLAYLAELFEENKALDKFEGFVSIYGARRYCLPLNQGSIRLKRRSWIVPEEYCGIVPDLAGRIMKWQITKVKL